MSESNQKTMDPAQLHKMTEVMGADLRSMKDELQREREDKERIVKEQKVREEEFIRMQGHLNAVKEEKKMHYSTVMDKQVRPYLEGLRKSGGDDKRLDDSLSNFQQQLDVGLDNAFMDPSQLATLRVAVAASADAEAAKEKNQVTASKLEELFQTQKQWEEKFNSLQEEKNTLEQTRTDTQKEMETANTTKEQMVEDLKKELAELKAKHDTTLNNAEGHFKPDADVAMTNVTPTISAPVAPVAPILPTVTTIEATASSNFYGGFDTLFDFTPRDGWRSNNNN
jgi:flagellar biosynthesis GTPase FlhF